MKLWVGLAMLAVVWWFFVRREAAQKNARRQQPQPRMAHDVDPPTACGDDNRPEAFWESRTVARGAWGTGGMADAPRIPAPALPRGRAARLPAELLDDERDDYGDGPAVRLPLSLFIEYRDVAGVPSARRISVRNLRFTNNRIAINAYCHEREAPRCFIAERLVSATDCETGEILQDPATWFMQAYRSHPDGRRFFEQQVVDDAETALREAFQDAMLVLVYVARADGRMTAVERQVIVATAAKLQASDPVLSALDELTDARVQRMRCDHGEFLRAVRNIKKAAPWMKTAVLDAAKAVMDADAKQDPGEAKALAWLDRSFR